MFLCSLIMAKTTNKMHALWISSKLARWSETSHYDHWMCLEHQRLEVGIMTFAIHKKHFTQLLVRKLAFWWVWIDYWNTNESWLEGCISCFFLWRMSQNVRLEETDWKFKRKLIKSAFYSKPFAQWCSNKIANLPEKSYLNKFRESVEWLMSTVELVCFLQTVYYPWKDKYLSSFYEQTWMDWRSSQNF